MLSPWAARGHRGGKMTKNGVCCHYGLKKQRGDKMTKNGACCHHGLLESTAVAKGPKMVHVDTMGCQRAPRTQNDRNWGMLTPWVAREHRGETMTKNGACCHHGHEKKTAVTK